VTAAATESPLAIVASGLGKRFPGVRALTDVSLALPRGEVTAVVGENGAGKSTLMTILAGLQRPDDGTVTVDGRAVRDFTPHRLLTEHGVALVPQEIALCRERTVAANVMLGQEPGLIPSRERMVARTRELLAEIETPIDPRRMAGSLSVAEQQMLLIVRALARDCRVLILDEPTASLTPEEVRRLFTLLRRLRDGGTTIVYVSHRLPEIFALTDGIHVLRDGRHVASFRTADVDAQTLVGAMVGRQLAERLGDRRHALGDGLLEVSGLSGDAFAEVSLTVRAGEIVGVAGLPDSGRAELVAALFGAIPSTGEVRLDGERVALRSPRDAIRARIAYVPGERRAQGIFPAMDVAANLTVMALDDVARFGIVRRSALRRVADERLKRFDVRGRPGAEITQLSGGNQQKVILGRWLARDPRLLLLDEPTRGVDVGAKTEIHERLAGVAATGAAVLVSSSDLPELLRLCDRIVVMAQGRIVGSVLAADATEEGVMALATGVGEPDVLHLDAATTAGEPTA
jgi:ABC-type sugar transport system ATPase subunit